MGVSAVDESVHDDLVSVICPAYNSAKYLDDAIQSVIRQTHRKWELIIVDDCSEDCSLTIAREFAGLDPRICVLEMATNGGGAAARNRGLEFAKGRWIALLDADDWWLPRRLEASLTAAKKYNSKLTCTAYRPTSDNGEIHGPLIRPPIASNYRGILTSNTIGASTVLIDRHETGNFVFPESPITDMALWLKLLNPDGFVHGIQEELVRYRLSATSMSRNKFVAAKNIWLLYRTQEKLSLMRAGLLFAVWAAKNLGKYVLVRSVMRVKSPSKAEVG